MHPLVSRLKVRHFQLIAAMDDHGTMHSAARVCHMTQSTASKMLSDLEAMLGTVIFERSTRGMTATSLGTHVVKMARTELARLDAFAEDYVLRRDGGFGILSVGAIIGSAPDLIARAVADIRAMHPRLSVHPMGETSDDILDMLGVGKIDLAVGRFASTEQRRLFAFEPLGEEPLVIVARTGSPAVGRFDGTIQSLAKLSWVVQPTTAPIRQLLDASFLEAGLDPPDGSVECASILAIMNLIRMSDMVALLPAAVVEAHLQAGFLVTLPLERRIRVGGFGILTRHGETQDHAVDAFADLLRHHARNIGFEMSNIT